MAYSTRNSTRTARRELDKVHWKSPQDSAVLAHVLMIDHLRSWNGATERNIELAKEHLKNTHARGGRPALAHVAEGQICEAENGNLPGAIDEFNKALKIDSNLAIAYAHKANAKILLGRAKKAPELLAKAIASPDSDRGLCCWFMGRAYFNMGNYPDAIWWLKKSVDIRPTTWFSWAHLISAYMLTKPKQLQHAKDAANKYCHRFKTKWPLDPNIIKYYAQLKYTAHPNPELGKAVKELLGGLDEANKHAGFP